MQLTGTRCFDSGIVELRYEITRGNELGAPAPSG
jgi:hypothetical protein